MKTYRVFYEEVIEHVFYVDAESKDDIIDEFNKLVEDGKIDFSNGEVTHSDIEYVEEVD
jgi:hypothetical protein